jgi:hypothetical protein
VGISNLFRRNSFAPKLLALYALSVGSEFLCSLLQPVVSWIIRESGGSKGFEIDPNRLRPNESLSANQKNLEEGVWVLCLQI